MLGVQQPSCDQEGTIIRLEVYVLGMVKQKDGKNSGPGAAQSTQDCQPLDLLLHETNKAPESLW